MSDIDREIKMRIKNILLMVLFITFNTWFWFDPRMELVNAQPKLQRDIDYLKITGTINNFKIENTSKKNINYVISISNDAKCNKVSNNYIIYNINTADFNSGEKNLNSTGNIYKNTISGSDIQSYSLDYKINSSNQCFTPKIELKEFDS